MPPKRINLKYTPERCILSDTLPYEVPLTFSNYHFFSFLLANRVTLDDNKISWVTQTASTDTAIRLLFSLPASPDRLGTTTTRAGNRIVAKTTYLIGKNTPRPCPANDLIPFQYKIQHKQCEFRELTVPHPRNQLQTVAFYDRYKDLILHFCSGSPYSVRYPARVARSTYHRDRTHFENLTTSKTEIENQSHEYQNIRSFFVYKQYSNVYKFYESFHYHRCEKKYSSLLKLDITKCFDSIYTHSVAWAIYGKHFVKENLSSINYTFPGKFDTLMQAINFKETNGIVIGPEFSRIFAELILQSVDRQVEQSLQHAPNELRNKVDYEVLRYVDDYFVFYNDIEHREQFVKALQYTLSQFKLHLNTSKEVTYNKPIITEITRAKRQITTLLNDRLKYKLDEIPMETPAPKQKLKGSIHLNFRNLAIDFKSILQSTGVEYKDILNFSLAVIENKCERIFKRFGKADKSERSEKELADAIVSILEFAFFIYTPSPRVNSTIILCRILRMACDFFRGNDVCHEHRHLLFKHISDDIRLVLRNQKNDNHSQLETLYLLISLGDLGKGYWLEQEKLAEYIGLTKNGSSGSYNANTDLNYFSLTVILFYIRDKVRYSKLRSCISETIRVKFESRRTLLGKDGELTMLLLDSISCPYLSIELKRDLLSIYGVSDHGEQDAFMAMRDDRGRPQQWFTTWHNFDLGRELDRKKALEVY